MSNVQWKKVLLRDVMGEVRRGKRLKKSDREEGEVPLVTAGYIDMGVSGYIKEREDMEMFTDSITVDMFGNCFFRDYDFYADDNILVFSKEGVTENQYLFLITLIGKETRGYSYNKQYRKRDYDTQEVILPYNSEIGDINWEYMENYIREKQQQVKLRLEQLTSINETPKTLVYSELEGGRSLDWENFTIKELFNVIPTSNYGKLKDREIEDDGGDVRFITTTSFNNGVKSYSKLEPNNEGNVITYSDTTNEDSIFYQDEPFIGRSHVQKLIPRFEMDKFIAMYIITSIKNSVKGIYDYSNKFNRKAMNGTEIPLPVTSEGEPHWEFIRGFMETQQVMVEQRLNSMLKVEDAEKELVFNE